MKALVHIGFPKTGTSSIQKWLGANKDGLLQQGVLYERVNQHGLRQTPSQVELAFACQEELGIEADYAHLRRQFAIRSRSDQTLRVQRFAKGLENAIKHAPNARLMALSSENVSSQVETTEEIAALDRWLARIFEDVEYVVYIRRQEDYLASRYCQGLRNGSGIRPPKFLRRFGLVDYHALTCRWRDVVGDRFKVRLFEKDLMPNGDAVEDFAKVLGVDTAPLISPERENESFSFAGVELMHAVNQEVPRYATDDAQGKNPLLHQLEAAIFASEISPRKFRLSQQEVAEVRERNAEGNEKLRALLFPDKDALFPERALPEDENEPMRARLSEVARLAVRVALHLQNDKTDTHTEVAKRLETLGQETREDMSAKD